MCKGNRSERLKSHGGVQQRSALDDEMASRRFIETGKPILSLCTFVRLSRMCLYYLRSASLQALATNAYSPAATLLQLLRPRPYTNVFGISSRTSLPTLSRSLCSQQAATLRNFISYARVIICRSFTHVFVLLLPSRVSIPCKRIRFEYHSEMISFGGLAVTIVS